MPVLRNQCVATHWCVTRSYQVCRRGFVTFLANRNALYQFANRQAPTSIPAADNCGFPACRPFFLRSPNGRNPPFPDGRPFFLVINIGFCSFCVVTDIVCCCVAPNSASYVSVPLVKKSSEHWSMPLWLMSMVL